MLQSKSQVKRSARKRSENHVKAAKAGFALSPASQDSPAVRAELAMLSCGTFFERRMTGQQELIPAFKKWSAAKVADYLPKIGAKLTIEHLESQHQKHLNRVVIDSVFGRFDCTWDDYRLRQYCDEASQRCARYLSKRGASEGTCEWLLARASVFGIKPNPEWTVDSALLRFVDKYWWRAKMRQFQDTALETLHRDLHYVGGSNMMYISDVLYRKKAIRAHNNRETLEHLYAVAEDVDGSEKWVNVAEAADGSQSNPINRAAFMAVRIKGLKELAEAEGHSAAFVTVTAPSRFHSTLKSGKPNPKYIQGCTARAASKWFSEVFQKIRSNWQSQPLNAYGAKVVEMHHDGCPHWHIILFAAPDSMADIYDTFYTHTMADGGHELKDKTVRLKWVDINEKVGDAIGYCIKYISKGLDSSKLDSVEDKSNGVTSADELQVAQEKMKYALSASRIQQFNFFGIPGATATVWNELRRMGKEQDGLNMVEKYTRKLDLTELESFALTALYKAADRGDWAAYCLAMGGVYGKREDAVMRILYSTAESLTNINNLHNETMAEATLNRYGEEPQAKVKGMLINIDWRQIQLVTRNHHYSVKTKAEFEKSQQGIMEMTLKSMDAWEQAEYWQQLAEDRFNEIEALMDKFEAEMESITVIDIDEYMDGFEAAPDPSGGGAWIH